MEGYRPCCVTRTFKYLSDARTVTASIEEVLKSSFDRYVPAHGAIIETGAQAALREGSLAMFQEFAQPPPPAPQRWPLLVAACVATTILGLGIAVRRAR